MSGANLLVFLRTVAARADVLESLKVKSKDEVIAAAAACGLPFTAADFDGVVWNLEIRLAQKRGEPLDAHFPLWRTLWGRYYLEFLVNTLIPGLDEADIAAVIGNNAGEP